MLGWKVATPPLTDRFSPYCLRAYMALRTRSANTIAPSESDPARTLTNSSPPKRPDRFIRRVVRVRMSAKTRSASSPA